MNINDKLNNWVDSLTARVLEIRFFEVDKVKAAISVHIKEALFDCIKVQLKETEHLLLKKKAIAPLLFGQERAKVQNELSILRGQLKKENMLYSELEAENFDKQLRQFIREKHPESFAEFKAEYNDKLPKLKIIDRDYYKS